MQGPVMRTGVILEPRDSVGEGVTRALFADADANAVGPGTSALVLSPSAEVGAPDGSAATRVSLLNTVLVLDMGQSDLRVNYRWLALALVTQVDFVGANVTDSASGTYHVCMVPR